MNKRIRQTTIMGREVQIYILKGSIGVAMSHKLGALVSTFFGSGEDGDDELSLDFGKIADALSRQLPYEELQMLIDSLLKDIAIDNKEIDFDEEFAGNYGFLTAIIAYALKENFGSFFEGLATLGE